MRIRHYSVLAVILMLLAGIIPVLAANPLTEENGLNSNTAIVLAIDTSDSMYGTPLTSAKVAASVFLDNLNPNTPVAVVTFSSKAELVHDFSVDHDSLMSTIEGLNTSGVTALYDGSLMAVETASSASAAQRVVVLLSDGAEYGGQSVALRDEARTLAEEEGVMVFTVGLGFGIDRTFLEEIAQASAGEMFEAPTPNELLGIYNDLSLVLEANAPEEVVTSDTVIPAASDDTLLPLFDAVEPITVDGASDTLLALPAVQELLGNAQSGTLESPLAVTVPDIALELGEEEIALRIPALADSLLAIGLNDPEPAEETSALASLDAGEREALAAETLGAEIEVADVLDSEMVPITVGVNNPDAVIAAELALNGFSLAVFEEAPFNYDLDLTRLEAGLYNLTFTTIYQSGSVAMGEMEFEVKEATTPAGATFMMAQVDGAAIPFTLDFNPETGLTPSEAALMATLDSNPEMAEMSLLTIMLRPLNDLLPPEVTAVLFKSRPVLATIIVMIMTAILIPQGIFTLMWLLYTWNNPDAAEEYASPIEYRDAHYKFTALLPARKEEEVIYETIMKVNAIDYPEDLKEILVLIRDENDDATIAEAKRAMADLGNKPNIRLVTFNDGPYNKPNGLNRGFATGTGDVYCIFDAEDHPHEAIYNIVNTTMLNKGADVVQSGVQLMTYFGKLGKEPWFAALNVLEYFFWFKSGLHCFTREFKVTPLGGNTVFAKREWLERIGEPHNRWDEGHQILEIWDEHCLTEDADLGIRLTNAGASIQIVYTAEHATQEETPSSMEQFIKQRTRWDQGFYEVFRKGDWLGLPTMKQKIVALYILLNSLLQASMVLFLPVGVYIAFTQEIPVPFAIISWVPIYMLLLQLVIQLVGIREYSEAYKIPMPLGYRWKMAFYFYPFQMLLAISAARAIGRFVSGTNNWEKTAHSGAHRTTAPVAPRPVATPTTAAVGD